MDNWPMFHWLIWEYSACSGAESFVIHDSEPRLMFQPPGGVHKFSTPAGIGHVKVKEPAWLRNIMQHGTSNQSVQWINITLLLFTNYQLAIIELSSISHHWPAWIINSHQPAQIHHQPLNSPSIKHELSINHQSAMSMIMYNHGYL